MLAFIESLIKICFLDNSAKIPVSYIFVCEIQKNVFFKIIVTYKQYKKGNNLQYFVDRQEKNYNPNFTI